MLEINCPFCGKRSEAEFWCIGEGTAMIPSLDASADDLQKYLYFRTNKGGDILERWVHRHGCGEWLTVQRNTKTNVISSVSFMTDGSSTEGRREDR
ncbi:sarcosine oxidase subunit delta [Paraburkholderia sp. RL18-103-BIB-C]|uniref:sarcosine oxidase subunit delta n=1 Tax=Paraburkholderia sp. RL18-103-BIB-C TaxID=3031637 RepID=UPI0038BA48BF